MDDNERAYYIIIRHIGSDFYVIDPAAAETCLWKTTGRDSPRCSTECSPLATTNLNVCTERAFVVEREKDSELVQELAVAELEKGDQIDKVVDDLSCMHRNREQQMELLEQLIDSGECHHDGGIIPRACASTN